MITLYTTASCVNCPRVKQIILSDPDLKDRVEIKDAMENKEECAQYNIRAVPSLLIEGVAHHVAGSSAEEIKKLILGE